MLNDSSYLGVTTRYSKTGKYKISINAQVDYEGTTYYSAIVQSKLRSYWQPVIAGVNMTDRELKEYYEETI